MTVVLNIKLVKPGGDAVPHGHILVGAVLLRAGITDGNTHTSGQAVSLLPCHIPIHYLGLQLVRDIIELLCTVEWRTVSNDKLSVLHHQQPPPPA